MDHSTYVGERLAHHRAVTLDREIERRRRILDQGTTIAPGRPELTPLHALGVWFRHWRGPARIRFSH